MADAAQGVPTSIGWRELWRKEDWWAIWLGLGIVAAAIILFANGASLKWIAVVPAKWTSFDQLLAHFSGNWLRYVAQLALWLVSFSVALTALGHKARDFVPAFVLLYLLAIAGAVGAKKEDVSVAITNVVIWAIVMIFALPFLCQALQLPGGVAGAWIGTSEFADAAGLAATQTYSDMMSHDLTIAGSGDQVLWAFTLMKVVGRDVWIGIWAFIMAVVATTRWETVPGGQRPPLAQIWWRF